MLTVRGARSTDGPSLAVIDAATWSPEVSPAPPRSDDAPFWGHGIALADVLVAEDDGVVVGSVIVGQAIPLSSHAHVLQINGLAVAPSHQRRGVGRLLMNAGVVLARKRGARRLTLRVLASNQGAQRLDASCGFIAEGILRGEFLIAGALVDDVLMTRDLTVQQGS
jgi:ribosomal protein S18 acetylase RimI-like enzyme